MSTYPRTKWSCRTEKSYSFRNNPSPHNQSRVPTTFWPEALVTAIYLINRLPTKILTFKTPLQTLSEYTKIPPTLTLEPRVFGCSVFVHIPKTERTKIDPCAEKCVFVGYGVDKKGYRCYNPKKRHIYTTMDCNFLETEYFYLTQHTGQGEKESSDTVSWLSWIPSSEEVTHSTQAESHPSTEPTVSVTGHDLLNRMSKMSEVSGTSQTNIHTDVSVINDAGNTNDVGSPEFFYNHEETIEPTIWLPEEQIPSETEEATGRYVLPPRINRGVPPKDIPLRKKVATPDTPWQTLQVETCRKKEKVLGLLFFLKKPQPLSRKHWNQRIGKKQ